MTDVSPTSDAPGNLVRGKRLRHFSEQNLLDDARSFSSDDPKSLSSFKQINREQNRIHELDMWHFRRLQEVPMPDWHANVRTYGYQAVDTIQVVYFVQAEGGGPVKIGISSVGTVAKRIQSIQVGNPHDLVVRKLVVGDWRVETGLHSYFAPHRTRKTGEWFWPCPELVEISNALEGCDGDTGIARPPDQD